MLSGEGMRLSRVRENLKHGSLRGWRKRTGANTIRRQLLKAAWLSIDGPGDEEPTSEARLHPTRHNFRATLFWARDNDPALGLGLAGDLSWFWYHHGQFREGRDWLAPFLATNYANGPPGPRARALTGAARLARYDNAPDQARVQAEEAVELARLAGNSDDLGYALYVLGLAAQAQNDHAAIAAAQASVAVFRDTTNRWGLALALFYLGTFSVFLGEDNLVLPALQESRAIFEELDDDWGAAGCLFYMGMMEERAGDLPKARSLIEQSVTLFRAGGDRWRLATALDRLAELRVAQGEPAAELTEEAASLRRQLGIA